MTDYTRQNFQQEFNLSEEDVKETLRACGLSLRKKNYTEAERERFAQGRQLFNEGLATSYDDIAAHFESKGVNVKSEATEESADTSLTEHIRALEEEAIQAGFQLGMKQAEIMGQVIPQIAIMRLKEMIATGELRENFQKLWQDALKQGNSSSLTEAVETRWREYQMEKYPLPTNLLDSSTESSDNEF
jgi:ABC-type transporter MlaC component